MCASGGALRCAVCTWRTRRSLYTCGGVTSQCYPTTCLSAHADPEGVGTSWAPSRDRAVRWRRRSGRVALRETPFPDERGIARIGRALARCGWRRLLRHFSGHMSLRDSDRARKGHRTRARGAEWASCAQRGYGARRLGRAGRGNVQAQRAGLAASGDAFGRGRGPRILILASSRETLVDVSGAILDLHRCGCRCGSWRRRRRAREVTAHEVLERLRGHFLPLLRRRQRWCRRRRSVMLQAETTECLNRRRVGRR